VKPNLDHPESLLRPLRRMGEDLERLRAGEGGDDRALSRRVLRAAEHVFRRMLRADSRPALELRLRALDPDELDVEEVLGELRRHDSVRMQTASAHHAVALRVASDQPASAAQLLELLDLLESDARALSGAGESVMELGQPGEDTVMSPAGEAPRPIRRGLTRRVALEKALIGAVALLVLVTVLWFATRERRGDVSEGVALFRSGELDAAADRFQAQISRNPDDITSRLYLARIFRRQGRHDDALRELRHAVERAPGDAAVHRELGLLFLDAGQPEAAARRFQEAVRLDSSSEAGWIGLVRALRESGDAVGAERVLRTAPPEVRALIPPATADP
jgi:tetratricopeptide (TPR) repeat protein